ncbi:BRCT domain-containing protein [Streptococcus sp. 10F2]
MLEIEGKRIVITGSLRPMRRVEVIEYLESRGGIVQSFVSYQTDLLIVGHRQLDLFEPEKLSKKYLAALALQEKGKELQIVSEEAFFTFIEGSQE